MTDKQYFIERAAQEQVAAKQAASDTVAAIHRKLAKRYLDLAEEPLVVDAVAAAQRPL